MQAVEGTNRSVEERLTLCEEVADVDLRAECISVVLIDRPGPPDDKCPLIPEGRWQDECWFDAAEMRVDHGSMQELVGYCGRAGRFANACSGHVGSILVDREFEKGIEASIPGMRKMVAEWVQHSGVKRDQDTLWRLYWQRRMEDPSVTLADCLALHPEPVHQQERSGLCDQFEAVQKSGVRGGRRWGVYSPDPTQRWFWILVTWSTWAPLVPLSWYRTESAPRTYRWWFQNSVLPTWFGHIPWIRRNRPSVRLGRHCP